MKMNHLALMSLLLLSACGFQPMAGAQQRAALPRVQIDTTSRQEIAISAQQFRSHLEDGLQQRAEAPAYRLNVDLSTEVSEGLIAPDGKAQRFQIRLMSHYKLTRLADGVEVDRGTLYRTGSYSNRPNAYFSTFVSEQDTTKRLSQELAEEYRYMLSSRLSSPENMGTPPRTHDHRGIF